ncbi:MAG: hypothetical protein J0H12_04115 [Candidatus Paracaedimonas acanthamoebae]|jgi:hypothetical protein|uniref:Uncharacterized protein n=1 Tax=Candidatus Paracaedimonas acanthamoebae TaxID=244581 RepID=A0A8J7PW49_9PROT|nr:hypothetical protein [Candidatus Paracaedimonas acanthamoebae]
MKTKIKMDVLEQRFFICLFAAIFAFFWYVAWGRGIYDFLTSYIVIALLLDQLSRFIKPTPMSKKELLKQHKVTQAQLNKYVQSKRNYRLFAVSVASLVGGIAFAFGGTFSSIFAITCALIWCLYPLYRIRLLKIPAPQIKLEIRRQAPTANFLDSFYDELNPGNSLAWNSGQSDRMHELMNSASSTTSHSRNLH